MYGLPSKGLTIPSLLEIYEQRPAHNDLVLYVDKRLWVVEAMDLQGCKLVEMRGMEVTDTVWEIAEPMATNYWYIPLVDGRVVYPKSID